MVDDTPTLVPLDTAADLETLLADAEPTIGVPAQVLRAMAAADDRDAVAKGWRRRRLDPIGWLVAATGSAVALTQLTSIATRS